MVVGVRAAFFIGCDMQIARLAGDEMDERVRTMAPRGKKAQPPGATASSSESADRRVVGIVSLFRREHEEE